MFAFLYNSLRKSEMILWKIPLDILLCSIVYQTFTSSVELTEHVRDDQEALVRVCRYVQFGIIKICFGVYLDNFWVIVSNHCGFDIFDESSLIKIYMGGNFMDCSSGEERQAIEVIPLSSEGQEGVQFSVQLIRIDKPFVISDTISMVSYIRDLSATPKNCSIFCNFKSQLTDIVFIRDITGFIADIFFCQGNVRSARRDIVKCQKDDSILSLLFMQTDNGDNYCLNKTIGNMPDKGSPIMCNGNLVGFVEQKKDGESVIGPIALISNKLDELLGRGQPNIVYSTTTGSRGLASKLFQGFSDIYNSIGK